MKANIAGCFVQNGKRVRAVNSRFDVKDEIKESHCIHFTCASKRRRSPASRLFLSIACPCHHRLQLSPTLLSLWKGNLPSLDGLSSQRASHSKVVYKLWLFYMLLMLTIRYPTGKQPGVPDAILLGIFARLKMHHKSHKQTIIVRKNIFTASWQHYGIEKGLNGPLVDSFGLCGSQGG